MLESGGKIMGGFVAAISNINIDIIYKNLSRIPKLGEEVFSKGFDIQIGGGYTASLIALSRLGGDARLGTLLSNDILSQFASAELGKNNVKVTNLYNGEKSPLLISSIITFPKDRCFITYRPEEEVLKYSDEEIYSAITGAKICMRYNGHEEVFKTIKCEGTKAIYDVGWSDDLSLKKIENDLKDVYVFTPNEKEALKMTHSKTLEQALKIISGYVENVIITMGQKGCMSIINGQIVTIPSLSAFKCIDTTGAGDAFLGGLAYGLVNNWDMVECMKLGNVLGGYSTTEYGACKAYLTKDKAKEYMKLWG